jgi:dTDP-4-dehydrorhamnose 3,5-epimerase
MDVVRLEIPEVLLLRPRRFADPRGWFNETWSRQALAQAGLACDFVQDNLSYSARAGTVRGLHFQAPPHAQSKLVAVVTGAVLDVVVDVRRGSPTYGRHVSARLDAETGWQIFVPVGFLHGFVTLQDDTRVTYKVDAPYAPAAEGAVIWNDPDLAIAWGVEPARAILSDKDAAAPRFADLASPFSFAGVAAAQ